MKNLSNATYYLSDAALKGVGVPLKVLLKRLIAIFEEQTGDKVKIELLHGREIPVTEPYGTKFMIIAKDVPLANVVSSTRDCEGRALLGHMAAILSGPIYSEYREYLGRLQLLQDVLAQLSYSESRIVARLLEELLTKEDGVLTCVATNLARAERLTRSVALSALSKLEVAGLIRTMNMGMKGMLVTVKQRQVLVALQRKLKALPDPVSC